MSRPAPLPPDEAERLQALHEIGVFSDDPDVSFDTITLLAKTLFETRFSAISLIDRDRQLFKAVAGVSWPGTSRAASFCAYTILGEEPLVVPDTQQDARFKNNPLVIGRPGVRFYAGVPLNTRKGSKIGALCVIDTKPRKDWTEMRSAMLAEMARMACHEMEIFALRKREQELLKENRRLMAHLVLAESDEG